MSHLMQVINADKCNGCMQAVPSDLVSPHPRSFLVGANCWYISRYWLKLLDSGSLFRCLYFNAFDFGLRDVLDAVSGCVEGDSLLSLLISSPKKETYNSNEGLP